MTRDRTGVGFVEGGLMNLGLEEMPAPVVVLDERGVVVAANQQAVTITGQAELSQLIGVTLPALVAGEDRAALEIAMATPAVARLAFRLRGDLGGRIIEASVHRAASVTVVVLRDATDLVAAREHAERLEAELRHSATHDALTGLPNRALLLGRLAQYAARNHRFNYQFAVLFFDLDGFKAVNDRGGHEAGDAVLRAVGARLQHVVGDNGIAARLGGDEFVVVLDGFHDDNHLGLFATRCIEEVVRPINWNDTELSVGITIGIARPAGSPSPDDLLAAADQAMYHAKQRGKGCWEFAARATAQQVAS